MNEERKKKKVREGWRWGAVICVLMLLLMLGFACTYALTDVENKEKKKKEKNQKKKRIIIKKKKKEPGSREREKAIGKGDNR